MIKSHLRVAMAGALLFPRVAESESARAAEPAPGAKTMAYLVIVPGARQGSPELPLQAAFYSARIRKYQARLKAMGFTEGAGQFAPDMTLDFLKQFNLVVYPGGESDSTYAGFGDLAAEKKALLLRYVEEGGGLLLLRSPGWQYGADIEILNAWLKPTGIEVLSEMPVRLKAANDNFLMRRAPARSAQDLLRMPFIPRREDQLAPPAAPLRIGFRPLLIVAFSGLILVALCGAFLLGLAFVGLLAGAVAGFDLVRRYFCRPARTRRARSSGDRLVLCF